MRTPSEISTEAAELATACERDGVPFPPARFAELTLEFMASTATALDAAEAELAALHAAA